MKRGGARSVLEKETQRQIEAEIGAEPDLLILRNSVGLAQHINEDDGKVWFVPYGLGEGSPDLVAMLRVTRSDKYFEKLGPPVPMHLAVWFCIEVKADEGKPSDEQEKCHRLWRRFGALVYVCRSAKEAREALEDARERVWLLLESEVAS